MSPSWSATIAVEVTRALLIVLAACASTPLAPLDDGFDTAAGGVSNVTSLSLRQDGVVVREGYSRRDGCDDVTRCAVGDQDGDVAAGSERRSIAGA